MNDLKKVLRYEYLNRDKVVLHIVLNKEHLDSFGSVDEFLGWSTGVISNIFGVDPLDFPVAAANLEMDGNANRAHWHLVFYSSAEIQQKIQGFCDSRTGIAAYLAVCLKNQLALKLGIEKKDAKKIKGVSVTKPEVKKLSQIDYIVKEGINNFMVKGLDDMDTDEDFDIWKLLDGPDFYRKNCSGPKPEGGVRALFPGRTGPALVKRQAKDEIDEEEIARFYIEKKCIPTEDEFRLYMFKNYQKKTICKQMYALVKSLIVDVIGVPKLGNPRQLICDALLKMNNNWRLFAKSMLANARENPLAYRRQYTYFMNANQVLNKKYIADIFKWVFDNMFIDRGVKEKYKIKALIIEGCSNCGKSAFMDIIFPANVLGTRGLTMDMKYATHGMYASNCHLWVYRDINRALSSNNMLRFQSLIDGDEGIREIGQAEMQSVYPSRPIIGATTARIIEKFSGVTEQDDFLRTKDEQFINRLVVVEFPESVGVYNGDNKIDKSPLLKFLTLTRYFDVPEWMPFYLFWRYYFKYEDGKVEDDGFAYMDDVMSLCAEVLPIPDFVRDEFEANSVSDQEDARIRPEELLELSFGDKFN